MQKLKSEKGITLSTLVITIMVLLMISTPIALNFKNLGKVRKYTSLKEDIDTLRESIEIVYRDNKDISDIGPEYIGSLDMLNDMQGITNVKNDNDNDKYYVIDLNQLNEKLIIKINKLNFGARNKDTTDNSEDVYIINERSRTIYYVRGIEYRGVIYHRLQEKFSNSDGISTLSEENINQIYVDKYGSKAVIPAGYTVSSSSDEQVIAKGLVIKDTDGNEFVWIPTKSFFDEEKNEISMSFDRESFDGQAKGGTDEMTDSQKIYNNNDNTYYFYEKMSEVEKNSVAKHGGFYIARYETGSDTVRGISSSSIEEDTNMAIKANKPVYNFVSKEKAVTLSNNFAKDEFITSRLCSGYAWDTVLKFIEKTGNSTYLTDTSKGNHGNSISYTGKTASDKINNIYDLSGNIYEWTLENTSKENLSVVRGGAISSSDVAVTRKLVSDEADANIGFRITLFLK